MDLGHYGKKMVTNHHTVTRQVFPDKSNDQMIRVLSTSSSQRKDVQEDGVYYLGTWRPHLVHVTTKIVGLPPSSLTPK